jgi:hypothetical protein
LGQLKQQLLVQGVDEGWGSWTRWHLQGRWLLVGQWLQRQQVVQMQLAL